MQTIKPVAALSEVDSRESERRPLRNDAEELEVRALSDYELWFVGGGDGVPGWGN